MDVYEEIASFFNEPIDEVKAKCQEAHHRLNKLWKKANPVSEDDRVFWYRTSDAHIYEGANWHNMHIEIRRQIAEKAEGKILCFGAGIGTEGILAAEMGKDITFYDLQGLIFDFLKFRVKSRNLKNTRFIDQELKKEERGGVIYYVSEVFDKYDTIICIDVLEHLEHPQEVLNFLGKHLKPNGLFLISAPFSELEYLGHLSQNMYLDIDLMMRLANIKNYRKEILDPYRIGRITPSPAKTFLLNIVAILPIRDRSMHRVIFFLTPTKKKMKALLQKIGITENSKTYHFLRILANGEYYK